MIIDIEPVGSRKDNYRIRFEDGRERNVSEDKLKVVDSGDKLPQDVSYPTNSSLLN